MNKNRPAVPASLAEAGDETLSATALAQSLREREAVLLELIRGQRTLSLYPESHPQRAEALAQSFTAISARLKAAAEMEFDVGRQGFTFRDRPIAEGNPSLAGFAREFHLRQVKKFAFRREMNLSEFDAFLRLLAKDAEAFRVGNLIEQHFRQNRIRGIWVNEIDFDRIKGAGGAGLEPVDGTAEVDHDQVEIEDLPDGDEDESEIKSRIRGLIAALDAEKDPDRFLELTRELEVLAGQLAREKNYEPAWVILAALSDHAETSEGSSEVCRKHALRSVRALAQRELLNYLLEHYTTVPEDRKRPYERVFRQLEMTVLEPILGLIGKNEALYSHRRLLDFMVELGPKLREPLETRLANAGTNLARKIVFLLGEFRMRESVETLRGALSSQDLRIRKEGVRALAKIRGAESSRVLIAGLGKKMDPETRVLIAQTLGETRELSAVPALINLLRQRSWLDENYELLSAAAQALGQIGSKEALPVLTRTLHHRKLIQNEPNQRLRIAAAGALGRIGGASAIKALKRQARGKEDALDLACSEALAQAGEGTPASGGRQ